MSEKAKMLPIFCAHEREHTHKVGEIGYSTDGKPVLLLHCRRHRQESQCQLPYLFQAWRDLAHGDEALLQAQITRFKKAVLDLETDLEDVQQQKKQEAI